MKKNNAHCPVCNGKLVGKKGSVLFPLKRQKINVDDLVYLECVKCKEKIFSFSAQQKIELSVYKPKTKKTA
ncbi:MAG: hypothetical protein A2583_10385 [Bdellovibrionales bacterium RIFOXYD1_FULL_53_11]|nr:MAG: hypothetical protein A2583_10385 [Bdellovibrionales bacterium RIFOXYD1_FULL_53_11]